MSVHTTVSDSVREQIATKLATRPAREVVPVCYICFKGVASSESLLWVLHRCLPIIRLSSRAEEIVWHLQSWCVWRRPFWATLCRLTNLPCSHGKMFKKRYIMLVDDI